MKRLLLMLVSKVVLLESILQNNPIVELEDGKIQGKLSQTYGGKSFFEFHNIPYAAPPVGNLRFAEPVSPEQWKGVINGTETTKICVAKYVNLSPDDPRLLTLDERENEDCLYLYVLTPFFPKSGENSSRTLLPIYVYIYGGIYSFGEPTPFNFELFLEENIVIVSFSYRSSSLGFLTTGDGVIPANIALKDQVMALKWINKNIARFGGDPTKVTIGGHSSGSTSTGYHLLNINNKGLFRSAILQSGTPLQPVSFIPPIMTKKLAFLLGESLSSNFSSAKNTSEELLTLLRNLPVGVVTKTEFEHPNGFYYPIMGYRPLWVPTAENSKYENTYVESPLHDNIENGIFNRVPVLMGIADEEQKHYDNVTAAAALLDINSELLLDPTVAMKKENIAPMVQQLKNIYLNSSLFSQNLPGLIKLFGDLHFAMPMKIHAYLHSSFEDVYFYQFSYLSPINGLHEWKKADNYKYKELGNVAHGEELQVLFNFKVKKDFIPSDMDIIMRRRLVKLWSNFIKYTNPTPEEDTLLQNIIWPKMTQDNFQYLDINSNLTLRKDPYKFKEWRSTIEKFLDRPRNSF